MTGRERLLDGTLYGVEDARISTVYKQLVRWPKGYPFGCPPGKDDNGYAIGNSRHHGVDLAAAPGTPSYAWGRCKVVRNDYDPGGYHRFQTVYFPDLDLSLTMGHLLNGSAYPVGTWFDQGDLWGRVGTKEDGINHPHIHFRLGRGLWIDPAVTPCGDIDPLILWKRLGLPA